MPGAASHPMPSRFGQTHSLVVLLHNFCATSAAMLGQILTGRDARHRLPGARPCRRGNCHDNTVAESFFQRLKRERIRRRSYPSRDAARPDVFEYIEMFYNPKRKHTKNRMLSPLAFETRQQKLNEAGV